MASLLEKVATLISANLHSLVDQALKSNSLAVIDQYIRQVDDSLADLEERLRAYEGQYYMSSPDFYQRFRAGQLGDDIEFVEWSVFYEMHRGVQERLSILMAETAA